MTTEDIALSHNELISKYNEEIERISSFEKETQVFGFYNAWWVFGEVAKEVNYDIFMAEAENVGYKRTKRGENIMQNDLFDLEYAPSKLDTEEIIDSYDKQIKMFTEVQIESRNELIWLEKKLAEKETENLKKKIDKINEEIEAMNQKIYSLQIEKKEAIDVLEKYYNNKRLKDEYLERDDIELINLFKNGILSRYKSDDIALRSTKFITILDNIRNEVIWE
ncbi:hypothetical protein ACW9KT_16010 [Hymenobacter sp. HD11105]